MMGRDNGGEVMLNLRLIFVMMVVALVFATGCKALAPGTTWSDPNVAGQIDQLNAWLKTRLFRNFERLDAPEMKAERISFLDCTTNGEFNVNLFIETNQLNVVVGNGLYADEKEEEFDCFCTMLNQGHRFWHWRRDYGSGALVVQCTIHDYPAILEVQPTLMPTLISIAEDECRGVAPLMRKLKAGQISPDDAFETCPKVESFIRISESEDSTKLAEEVYKPLWNALCDKQPVKWEGDHVFPIKMEYGLSTNVTKSVVSTNMLFWIRADHSFVECLAIRPWGRGDKLKKFAQLAVRCNQTRGDGRWAGVEGGEFCIRGTYPLHYVLADPQRFVNKFVMLSAAEIMSHEDEMRELLGEKRCGTER